MKRSYGELIDFMKALGDGVLDYLPEDQRGDCLTIEEIVEQWMSGKSYWAARSLKADMVCYIRLYRSGDYSVDEVLFWYDLCFIPERFGVEEHVFFERMLGLIGAGIEKKKRACFDTYIGFLSRF